MLRFDDTKAIKKDYAAKKPIKIWDVSFDHRVISKLIKTKTNSKYFIGYLDKAIRPLVLIIRKTIFPYLFSVHNAVTLSSHEQVCLMRLRFKRYFSHEYVC